MAVAQRSTLRQLAAEIKACEKRLAAAQVRADAVKEEAEKAAADALILKVRLPTRHAPPTHASPHGSARGEHLRCPLGDVTRLALRSLQRTMRLQEMTLSSRATAGTATATAASINSPRAKTAAGVGSKTPLA